MRIISWNCCGKFREKYSKLMEYDADIYIIQECENPSETADSEYRQFSSNGIWQGFVAYKGLGVFAKQNIRMARLSWDNHLLRHFIPLRINDSFTLLAVWAGSPYIEEYAIYQSIHYDKYDNKMVIMGDFNSNKNWDRKHQRTLAGRSHSSVVERLEQKGLYSAYHCITGEGQGTEKTATFYLHHNKEKAYHIDYCFVEKSRIEDFSVLESDFWLQYSDHIPLVVDIKDLNH